MARLEFVGLELHIAGCPNTCRHCKDDGRPPFGALMSLDDVRWVLEQFRSVADMLSPCVYERSRAGLWRAVDERLRDRERG
jgi:hypothetical protein